MAAGFFLACRGVRFARPLELKGCSIGAGASGRAPTVGVGPGPQVDGFGLIAFARLFPIISVLGYAQISAFLDQRRERQRNGDASTTEELEA